MGYLQLTSYNLTILPGEFVSRIVGGDITQIMNSLIVALPAYLPQFYLQQIFASGKLRPCGSLPCPILKAFPKQLCSFFFGCTHYLNKPRSNPRFLLFHQRFRKSTVWESPVGSFRCSNLQALALEWGLLPGSFAAGASSLRKSYQKSPSFIQKLLMSKTTP